MYLMEEVKPVSPRIRLISNHIQSTVYWSISLIPTLHHCDTIHSFLRVGSNMALLSKSIPRSFARGTFNAGFLPTEAGTLARSIGDVLITLAHHTSGISGMLDATFVPMLGLFVVSISCLQTRLQSNGRRRR